MFKNRPIMFIVLVLACAQIVLAQYATTKPISEPTIFAPGVIPTGDYEVCPQFSPNGETFYFVKSATDANFWTIVFSRFENGKWNMALGGFQSVDEVQ